MRGRRRALMILTAALVVALSVGAALAIHAFLGLLALRIAISTSHPDSGRMASALVQVFGAEHPRVRVNIVKTPHLAAAASTLDGGGSELAIVRSDAAGESGQTLVILRRDAAMVATVASRGIDAIPKLRGRKVGLLDGRETDGMLLDTILGHYGVPKEMVTRVPLDPDRVEQAMRGREVDAVFVVAPVASKAWASVLTALRKAREGAPELLEIGEAAAITKTNPVLETLDIPKGALQGTPPLPGDDVTTLSVSYRLLAQPALPDWLAGEITREVLASKPKLAMLDGSLAGIEAPDTDDKTVALPIHSGSAAFLSGNLPSLSDQAQNALYWLGLMASAVASFGAAGAAAYRWLRPQRPPERVMRLLEIWLAARSGGASDRAALLAETDAILHQAVEEEAEARAESQELRLISLLAPQVREALGRIREPARAPPT